MQLLTTEDVNEPSISTGVAEPAEHNINDAVSDITSNNIDGELNIVIF